jgi:HAD superfamily hydrolase (TIGR01509 family)
LAAPQVIQEVFCWTRNPSEVRRLAGRKEELLAELLGDRKPMVSAGVEQLLEMLRRAGAPVAIVSSAPERRVLPVLEASGLAPHFEVVVSGDDVYRGRRDPEGYLYAAQRIGRPPPRCVVLGSSNLSVEAAHEAGMACVAVAGTRPLYELTAADLVVRSVGELSFMNLKSLFSLEEGVLPHGEDGETEMEEETDEDDGGYGNNRTTVQLMEPW